jgi:hypothetical protein
MVRELSPHDLKLLEQMAPEFAGENCSTIGAPYKSLLPPVANHYATSADDFLMRVQKLSLPDLQYLCDLIISGEESLHCLSNEYFSMFITYIKEMVGASLAMKITARYVAEQE